MKKRVLTLLLALLMLLAVFPMGFGSAEAATKTVSPQYIKTELGNIQYSKNSTTLWKRYAQGMAIAGSYSYSAVVYSKYTKKASQADSKFAEAQKDAYVQIIRSKIGGGDATLTYTYKNKQNKTVTTKNLWFLGHANDMCAFNYGKYTYLLVTTNDNKLVLCRVSGTKIDWYRNYYMKCGNDKVRVTGITRLSACGKSTKFMLANMAQMYKFTLNLDSLPAGGKTIAVTEDIKLDIANKNLSLFGTTYKYGSGNNCWNFQGITYHSGKLYVPIFAHSKSNDVTRSAYLIFNMKGVKTDCVRISRALELEAIDFYGSAVYGTIISWYRSGYSTYSGYSSKLLRIA
ncbi:MAG: hypothetical protein IJ072_06225 [Oscillospiraceae bacterium]|nr:hypothetical protein [Oscillospiraceae bacterium]